MSLQFILGNSGAGKSYAAYGQLIKEAMSDPAGQYYVIVPEQYTMQTQKILVSSHPGGGILNIDVLSFQRFAYRIFEETGGDNRNVLEDAGKSMVIGRIAQRYRKKLPYLGSQMHKPGYIDEAKSLISEFMQYGITAKELEIMAQELPPQSLLARKLQDIGTMYDAFRAYLEERYVTAEELLDALVEVLPESERLAGATMVFDSFTGFTPIQIRVIGELLRLCKTVRVTLTMDVTEGFSLRHGAKQLFYMTKQTVDDLSGLTKQIEKAIYIKPSRNSRFAQAPSLQFLEENLFRYRKAVFPGKPEEISLFVSETPMAEIRYVSYQIRRLVRTQKLRYGDFAVITGDLEEYKDIAALVFEEAEIPYFIDEKRDLLQNPFAQYLSSFMDMLSSDFSYESVFHYLRSGMTGFAPEETDRMENYCLGLGLRGHTAYEKPWKKVPRGMTGNDLAEMEELRKRFHEEWKDLYEEIKGGRHSVREYCTALYHFLSKEKMQERLKQKENRFAETGMRDLEREYAQIYRVVINLLDKLVEILGEDIVSWRDFSQLLLAGFSQTKVGVLPGSQDQVLVGDMERTRLWAVKVLFFVGVNEGSVPKNVQSGGFLTESDRELFEQKGIILAPGPKEQIARGKYYLYLNLTKPSRHLYLSYSLSNSKGEALRPAYLVGTLEKLFPGLVPWMIGREDAAERIEVEKAGLDLFLEVLRKGIPQDQEPLFDELYGWFLRKDSYQALVRNLVDASFYRKNTDLIGKAAAKALYGEISPHAATRLERYCACAYQHFLQYGLGITERAEYIFEAVDMGNVMHQSLQRFSEELQKAGLRWRDIPEGAAAELADQCVEAVASGYNNAVMQESARSRYMIERTKRILHTTVQVLKGQLERGEFEPESFELSIEGGRIDRVDIARKDNQILVKVIDYKSGSTRFDLSGVYYGLQLQLALYLDAALRVEAEAHPDCEIVPAGAFYYQIRDPMTEGSLAETEESVKAAAEKELKLNGLAASDPEILESLDAKLISLPVTKKKDGDLGKGSSVAARAQFENLGAYVRKKIAESIDEIMEGEVSVSPYEMDQKNACTYCTFRDACPFDKKNPAYQFRRLKKFSDEEIWQLMEQA